jgi:hypothetical protein
MRLTLLVISASLMAAPVMAQTTQPAPLAAHPKKDLRLPIAVIDARGVFARLGQDPTTATGLSTTALDLPASGLGIAGGAHVYLWRGQSMAFGVGGEGMLAHAKHDLLDSTGKATGTTIDRRIRSASVNLSLNFGHRDGWSYLTVGIGPTSFESYLAGTVPDGLRESSLNYGGGARWFNWKHLAFTADMRFYQTKPALPTPNTAARVRHNVVVFSGGVAIK